ncbi:MULTISPECIES: hypothetical protein [Pseudovibrio]|jgi:hypothetical protein|uniref:Uncharacterized protein n=1 Tax=Pseudovibrio brasiliensis TaxID=1898042 RepID=A0ABX8ARU9_9HYPH|nr:MULTISPECIES: hypothetical protein [Pseudovibrio]KZK85790.1 hypothetical protein PsAD46_03381 [Pseudovibrio sp. Ad46]KZK97957.1 hypothetical protein PsAD5_02196 [Pseudovibrio sp. Ad5]KZL02249.1 hypothetical protein PsW74_01347 [Pseudovibrio sp. W74]KZL08207.1 hypothetical protein PsAD14_03354 [Pseudovibrio sp. Ad14]KZL10731.1 hypothetical protein PsAD26_03096 [Pseudovibrio sp. Ad26]
MLSAALDFIAQRCEVTTVGELIHLHVTLTQNEMDRLALFGATLDDLEPDDWI